MAERVGFEPTTGLPLYGISSAAPSTGLGDLSVRASRVYPAAARAYASTSAPSCAQRVWKLPARSSRRYVCAPK